MDMDLGDTRLILETCRTQGLLRNQTAYVLATAFWETARTMEPVREAFWLSEQWRADNLRYYPWYGRGYVQITWERNYRRAMAETGVDLLRTPDDAMRPDVAAQALVVGCRDGWFTGKKLDDYITLKRSDYVGARRVVNGTDKARAIAEIARDYEAQLLAIGYGVEKPVPVANERRDGTPPRTSLMQSKTNWGAATGVLALVGSISDQVKEVVATVSESFGVSPQFAIVAIGVAGVCYVIYDRSRKGVEGDH